MYLFVRGIDFASFYNFPIGFWICSNSVVFLVILKTNYSKEPRYIYGIENPGPGLGQSQTLWRG
jgi:hypothetical protein